MPETETRHGAATLPSVEVNSYNVELKDDEGFLGDRASKDAFRDIIENWRKPCAGKTRTRSATSRARRFQRRRWTRC